MRGLLRDFMKESLQVVAQRASQGRKRWIDTVKDCLKKKKREVWISGKQGEWCMIGVNGGSL